MYTKEQMKEIKQLDGFRVASKKPCPLPKCNSSDAAEYYQKDYKGEDVIDGFCFSCHGYIAPDKADPNIEAVDPDDYEQFSTEQIEDIVKLPSRGWRERKVSKTVSEFYGVKTELSDRGSVLRRYYPVYFKDDLVAYKARNCVEKAFWSVGKNKAKAKFFGQNLFPKGGNVLIIAGGEEDAMSAYDMLSTDKYTTACIAPTVGESSCHVQLKHNFEYVSSFKKVIFMLDNDKAGQEATERCMKMLRPGQAYTWTPPQNGQKVDCNWFLVNDKQAQFKKLFFEAEKHCPAGVVSSASPKIYEAIMERAKAVKIPLPDFAEDLEDMLRGGPALGEITLLTAASSVGKTSILNAFVYDWIFKAPYKVGIISLESDLGELGENLLSVHIGKKLANLYDDEKIELLSQESTLQKWQELQVKEDGEARFTILDHQSSIMDDELKQKIEYLVKVDGCKIIIIDPLTLALSGESNEGMDLFNAWYLRFVKREQIAAFNVYHVRKNSNNQKANSRGAELSEESIKGSSSAFQTAMNIWLFMRDKYHDDPVVRNTTKVVQSKARRTGLTGLAGYWYYNSETGLFEKGRDVKKIDTDEELEEFTKAGAFNDIAPEEDY